ncbi:BNR-4 repeat-containing protein [uncultured Polaribacter sp.]|uniref:BNR-4 repeat-containing protein n=1 Tax=uncultured Polaribacter sp. TaxID=174711 RepID=UPI0026238086|nr:BNR-4 repeat-containing protein [uncultured Polaribacter sp.]
MKKITFRTIFFAVLVLISFITEAQVTLEKEVKITDLAMYFNGVRNQNSTRQNVNDAYDYSFGAALTPHGDCIKVFGDYVFLTWYRGGKEDRHVMLTRYNQKTGVQKTIEFPHRHTGFQGKWWIGETHNTIAIGISPKNGSIHMVYDMHRNGRIAAFANDYLRYSYTTPNAATVPDDEFTLDLFVQSPNNNYKHLRFPGITDDNTTKLLTYPAFFTNDEGDLFMKNRFGFSENGKFLFAKYDGNDWEGYTDFNRTSASSHGSPYNWGLYGDLKYLNGKIRVGFQQRANVRNDKYQYQNGFYYAYSDDPSGLTQWKDHKGTGFTRPLAKSDLIKISEPGDLVETTGLNQVYMVQGFDWTVTDNDDVHFIGRVKDNENNVTKQVHTYKAAGASEFTTSTDFSGAETLYSAGGNVYIIGLNSSGRPFVEQAPGGTNLFTRVYEATSGKRFRKGQVYISDGKLYYYLLENNASDNDDTQPTYLQIIDLNIVTGPQPFAVNLVTPTDNQSFREGQNIQLFANATADEGEITKVAFMVDDTLLQEDTTKPYLLDWTPSAPGTYAVKADAYKTSGERISSSEITIEVIAVDKSDLTFDTYRLKNVATGKFLVDAGGSAVPVSMSDSGEETNTHWTFVKAGEYYNIDSETFGILRAPGSGFENGTKPFFVVSTGKASPSNDSDKVWKIHYNETDDTFRFESKDNNRYLYYDADGNVTNIAASDTDDRSKWEAVSTSQTLSINREILNATSIKVYPNPAEGNFTISVQNINKIERVEIYNMLGKRVYQNRSNTNTLEINSTTFSSGVYIINVLSDDNKSFHSKLVIN